MPSPEINRGLPSLRSFDLSDPSFSLNGPSSSSLQGQLPDTYLLGAGDRVYIDIFDVPEYSKEYTVLSDGSIVLPQGGGVAVAGLTLKQAEQTIAQQLRLIVRRPLVTLSLTEARPLQLTVAGEVKRPGVYTSENPVVSLTQILEGAGGVTAGADIRQVSIQRRLPKGQGGTQTLQADLWQLLNAGDTSQNLMLQDGDVVMIPATETVDLQAARRLASATFASQSDEPIAIAVLGQVQRPGSHLLDGEIQTVSAAIDQAGGITQSANVRQIEVRRTTNQGQTQIIPIDFWKLLQEGDLAQDLPLQTGDAVVVPQGAMGGSDYSTLAISTVAPDKIPVNLVGEVKAPGTLQVPPNTPLIQTILAAGGFSDSASKGSVQLVRLNPDGTVTQRTIAVDLSRGLDGEDNPLVQPNDTIIVSRSGLGNFQNALRGILSPITGVFSIFRLLGL
ncbi:hypothetical protein PROH_21440 [Prochlorothrix hollandica PCC 9006 = CALU 1027]|uniref:Sugar ABC transporter substrate-binding protein n=1 Tax=Prochlorothrix hollandica PCC 9006 = CALU 1027 TaxID=317619 RepID=A0A0M2PUG5_PROHO|nr:hypothetical protein PROH_21440 [Prochlorothrix hollandica PCC 9006 = CALU 1027]